MSTPIEPKPAVVVTLDAALAQALAAHQAGQYARAESLYRQILAIDPAHADALHLLGVLAHQTGHPDEAERLILAAIEANSQAEAYYPNLAMVLNDQGRFDEALRACDSGLRVQPDSILSLVVRAKVLSSLARYDESIAAAQRAIELDPRRGDAHVARGIALQLSGELTAAQACFEQAAHVQPDLADAYYNLGNLLRMAGQFERAIDCCREAVRLNPAWAAAHSNLGVALHAGERSAEAIDALQTALRLEPNNIEAQGNLAAVYLALSRLDEALDCCQRVVALQPSNAGAHLTWGNVLAQRQRHADALGQYRRAIELGLDTGEVQERMAEAHEVLDDLDAAIGCWRRVCEAEPESPRGLNGLGLALNLAQRADEAAGCFDQAIALDARYLPARINRALLLKSRGDLAGAQCELEAALDIDPDSALALTNLGVVLLDQHESSAAIAAYRRAIALDPNLTEASYNLMTALQMAGRFPEARNVIVEARTAHPDDPDLQFAAGLLDLQLGNFPSGWSNYEARWSCKGARKLSGPKRPWWNGEPLPGKTLLVRYEQGYGDTLQFIRYVPLIRQRVGRVIVECQGGLGRLLGTVAGIDEVVEAELPLPRFDVQVPLLSLPQIVGTTLETIPATVPYLGVDSARSAAWCQQLAGGEFRVGIVWAGNPRHFHDRHRSIPAEAFAPLGKIDGVCLFSLQLGPGRDQLAASGLACTDLAKKLTDFAETAAVVRNLHLVVCCDTSVAHLAGALGAPVWVVIGKSVDWRWLLARQDSPWYPTMRLYRQTTANDWASPLRRVASDLRDLSVATAATTDR